MTLLTLHITAEHVTDSRYTGPDVSDFPAPITTPHALFAASSAARRAADEVAEEFAAGIRGPALRWSVLLARRAQVASLTVAAAYHATDPGAVWHARYWASAARARRQSAATETRVNVERRNAA